MIQQTFYVGVVEDRMDPLELGRCKVRVIGLHTEDKSVLPTDKLPWAHIVQPANSAAMSGIGFSPTGLVEGTVVKIEFADIDQQQPYITGTIGGIPQGSGVVEYADDTLQLKNEDGEYLEDSSTVSTDDNQTQSSSTGQTVDDQVDLKPASSYSISDDVLPFIRSEENVRLNSYQDSGGVWTIGYGTTFIDGKPVKPNMTITLAQAESYLISFVNSDVVPAVKRLTKALITQSMFDALVSFVYNAGQGTYAKSNLLNDLNASKYLEAAARFSEFIYDKKGNKLGGLVTRRAKEKALFLKDGVPNDLGFVDKQSQTPVDETNSDGSTSPGIVTNNIGFKDPKGKYPLYLNEPDTNRLARHNQINKTIVARKEAARDKNVPSADGTTWNQSPIPYNAKYPYNSVYQSESGHVLEFDDTQHCERIHLYHKKGTFFEIDANGTRVTRVVGDDYEILERNGYIHIKGNKNVTVDGAMNVRVEGSHTLEVFGKTIINVYNDVDLNVSGSLNASVKESFNVRAKNIKLESYQGSIDVTASQSINVASSEINTTATSIKETSDTKNVRTSTNYFTTEDNHTRVEGDSHSFIGGDTYNRHDMGTDYGCPADPPRDSGIDCSSIDEATLSEAAGKTGLPTPPVVQTPSVPSFSTLIVETRGSEVARNYETPDDGDPTSYIDTRINDLLIDPEDYPENTDQAASSSMPANTIEEIDSSCDVIFTMEDFPATLQLSKYFTVGALNKQGTRKIIPQSGSSKQEIACNLKRLSVNCLDKIYELYPNMIITSGFRRPGDSKYSSKTSDHYIGCAADIVLNGFSREEHYNAIQAIQQIIPFDQLILEFDGNSTWIHVSYKYNNNRKQYFTMNNHKLYGTKGKFYLLS